MTGFQSGWRARGRCVMQWVVALTIVVAATGASTGLAGLAVSPLFGDNACLQSGKPIVVWGLAEPGAPVEVELGGERGETITSEDGRWTVELPARESGEQLSLKARSGTDEIVSKNIVIGEVWLAAGQSNMVFELDRTIGAASAMATAVRPDVRLFQMELTPVYEPVGMPAGSWQVCSPETAAKFSGVAYYFGAALNDELGVPVGLIQSALGGTPIESWLPGSVWGSSPELEQIFREQEARGDEHMRKKYVRVREAWERKGSPAATEPPQPDFSQPDRNDPTVCFNSGIAPLVPFPLAGFLWYQGEWNVSRASTYPRLQKLLVDEWRALWRNENLPFFFVQLPGVGKDFATEVEADCPWAAFREAQEAAADHPGVGMAVAIDVGGSLHPERKKEVGERLARLAFQEVYGRKNVARGPLIQEVRPAGGAVTVDFANADGLEIRGEGRSGFFLTENGKEFYPAQAEVNGSAITLKSEGVKQPREVRYLWAKHPEATVFNAAGLPAAPFRRAVPQE